MLVVIVLRRLSLANARSFRRCWRMRACVICRGDRGFQRQPSGDQPELQPGQQVTLAGYTFRFERLDCKPKAITPAKKR